MNLSFDILDIGTHLINQHSGETFVVNDEARDVLNSLPNPQPSEVLDFMLENSIVVKTVEDQKTFYLQWHLLNTCILNCTHCYDSKLKIDTLTYEQVLNSFDSFVRFLKHLEMRGRIGITGGEPLMYKKFKDVIRYMSKSDVPIDLSLMTSGIIMDHEWVRFIKDHFKSVQISIDGPEETHNAIRGKDTFKKSINSVQKLQDAGVKTNIQIVLMQKNIEVLEEFIGTMNDLGVEKIGFSRLVGAGNGVNEDLPTPETLKNALRLILRLKKTSKATLITKGRPMWAMVGQEGWCPVGYHTLTIAPNGHYLPCRRLPIDLGDARRDSFYKVWFESEFLNNMRNREKTLIGCGTCQFADKCGGCRAIAYAETKNAYERDPSCLIKLQ